MTPPNATQPGREIHRNCDIGESAARLEDKALLPEAARVAAGPVFPHRPHARTVGTAHAYDRGALMNSDDGQNR